MSALFPGSQDAGGFWRDILAGRDLLTDVPESHWLIDDYYDADPAAPDKTYCKRGAFLSATPFDPVAFGIPPSTLSATDTSQLLGLIVAKQVLDDASQGQFAAMDKSRISVILGATSGQELFLQVSSRLQRPVWVKSLREHGLPESEVQNICNRIADHYVPWQESTFPGLLGNVVAGRIANRFDLGGTNCVTDAACASSFAAAAMAVTELQQGLSDLVITGGADTFNDIGMYMCFSKTPALSATGDCRPFSDQADGTMMGEGLGMVALKRLADAERDGDRIYAVLKGVGSSSDGRAMSVYAPLSAGQARALERAYEQAGYGPETVELLEAHGTGTKAGDAAEFGGLELAFNAAGRTDTQWCALGSVKSQIGHTKAAAGAAGLFKVVMALHHKVLPPTIKVTSPNPKLALEKSPFYLNTVARPWIRNAAHPRRAGVSAFGFGGSNFHLTLEEYTGPGKRAWRQRPTPVQLVVLSEPNGTLLAARCRALAADAATPDFLAFFARASQAAFDVALPARLALTAADAGDLARKLLVAAERLEQAPTTAFAAPGGPNYAYAGDAGQVAFLFPGQGSQYVGMGADLAMAFDGARAAWDAAADQLPGVALHEVVYPHPVFTDEARQAQAARLTETAWAQPCIGAVSLSQLALLAQLGLKPAMVAGHSFGELTALQAAGAVDTPTFLAMARRRGELMAEAAAVPGAMLAVSSPREAVEALLAGWGSDVVVANHNSPMQVVLAGLVADVADAEQRLAAAGHTCRQLPVATAFHSKVVSASSAPFRTYLESAAFQAAAIPVYGNTAADLYPAAAAQMRDVLSQQLALPVRFVEMIEAMYAAGARTFVEVGPNAVLSQLVADVLGDRPFQAVALDRKGKSGLTTFWNALGQLAVAGVALDFGALWADQMPQVDPRTVKPPAFTVPLLGSNYGRPYPPEGGTAALPRPNPERPAVVAAPPVALVAPAPTPLVAQAAEAGALDAYQLLQQTLAASHQSFQATLADSQLAYMTTLERSFAEVWGGQSAAPLVYQAATPAPVYVAPVSVPIPVPVKAPVVAPAPTPVAAVPVVVAAPVVAAVPALDLEALMLLVVAEKTGYPAEMLNMEMALEADLGIDSIKRVEILAAVQQQAPGLPEVDAARMGALRTLGQIVEYMSSLLPTTAVATKTAPSVDLHGLMLSVVAEKTGYPAEMLNMEMALEADLGIDSIKRVEILAAVQQQAPGLPEVDAARMGALRTLGQIVEYMSSLLPSQPVAAATAPAPLADMQALMLQVVADKTGYPAEMLNLDMALEADLGIDSIKRVEILAAVQQQAPGLPEVDAARMASMRTLGQIVEAFRGGFAPTAPVELAKVVPVATVPSTAARAAVRAFAAPATGHAMLAAGQAVTLLSDRLGVAEALAERLSAAGVSCTVAFEVPAGATGLIFLGGLDELPSVDAAIAVNRAAFQAARAIASHASLFVTVQDTGGDFGLGGRAGERAWLGGLAGLSKTAAREWPAAAVKAIDLERGTRTPAALADALCSELLAGGSEREVGLQADDTRWVVRSIEAAAAPGELTLDATDVIAVSGGARGVTAATLIGLAQAAKPRFVLFGRTPLAPEPDACKGIVDEAALKRVLLAAAQATGAKPTPAELGERLAKLLANREVESTLAQLAAAGSPARYVPVDVQDAHALDAALATIRAEWGPITGVIHGAGVLADKLIAEKTDAQFDRVFDTKVTGLRALLDATANEPLKLLALFSSVAAREGNPGQADYAMANEVLNHVALAEAARRGPGCRVKSFNWGPWDGGMVTPSLRQHFASAGVALLALDAGTRLFVAELADARGDVALVMGGSLPGGGKPERMRHTLHVGAARHGYLADHRVQGQPVVPAALALEWFMRAARAFAPDKRVDVLRELRVLKGVALADFERGNEAFVIEAEAGARDTVALTLVDAQGLKRYTAIAEMTDVAAVAPDVQPLAGLPAAVAATAFYADNLFHGPAFQMVRSVEGPTADGYAGTLHGTQAAGWTGGPWQCDPAAIDGAIQLALVWGIQTLGRPSLPTRLGAFVPYVEGPFAGPVRVEVHCAKVGSHQLTARATFHAEDGRLLAELQDLELTLLAAKALTGSAA